MPLQNNSKMVSFNNKVPKELRDAWEKRFPPRKGAMALRALMQMFLDGKIPNLEYKEKLG